MNVYIYFKRNNKRFTVLKDVSDIKDMTGRFLITRDKGIITQVPKKSFKITMYGR